MCICLKTAIWIFLGQGLAVFGEDRLATMSSGSGPVLPLLFFSLDLAGVFLFYLGFCDSGQNCINVCMLYYCIFHSRKQ